MYQDFEDGEVTMAAMLNEWCGYETQQDTQAAPIFMNDEPRTNSLAKSQRRGERETEHTRT
jgi:hypothetical protein